VKKKDTGMLQWRSTVKKNDTGMLKLRCMKAILTKRLKSLMTIYSCLVKLYRYYMVYAGR